MRVVVTGANGFVAGHVIGYMSRRQLEVFGVVRSEEKGKAVVQAGGEPLVVPFCQDANLLAGAFEGADVVIHLIGSVSETEQENFDFVNRRITAAVVKACEKAGVKKLIYNSALGAAQNASAAAVLKKYFSAKESKVLMKEVSMPASQPYLKSKWAAEREIVKSKKLEWTIFRPGHIFGPGDSYNRDLVRDVRAGSVQVIGDGSYELQPVFIDDVVKIYWSNIAQGRGAGKTYDLVGPRKISYLDYVKWVMGIMKMKPKIAAVPVAEAIRRSPAGFQGMGTDELLAMLGSHTSARGAQALEDDFNFKLTPLRILIEKTVRFYRGVF